MLMKYLRQQCYKWIRVKGHKEKYHFYTSFELAKSQHQ